MKKIAVACEGKVITNHFGHCPNFMIYEVEDNEIKKEEFLESPEHQHGYLPIFLNEKGVNVVIAGCMGGGAMDLFAQNNIEVFTGINGDAKEAVEKYLAGTLLSTNAKCKGHEHKEDCDGHEHHHEHNHEHSCGCHH